MSAKLTLEHYRDLYYQKYPNRTWLKFHEKINRHIIVEDKYGLCKVAISHLMNGWMPSIRVALDRNLYCINKIKEVHGDKYNFQYLNYTGLDNNIKLICPKHGEFEITPHSITSQKYGCIKCGYESNSIKQGEKPTGWSDSDWFKKAKNSSHFDSFKVYVVKCWDENEEFYKIGKTFRILKDRLTKHKERMPYNYEVIKVFEFKDLTLDSAKQASIIERQLKTQNKEYKYVPLMNIRGKFECFKEIKI